MRHASNLIRRIRPANTRVAGALLLLLFATPLPAAAPLVVGTKEAPPFALRDADGGWTGISIELWDLVAAELGRTNRYTETELETLFDGLVEGRFDVSVAALTVTAEREQRIDFTHPYFNSGLAIAVASDARRGWLSFLAGFPLLRFLQVVSGLLLLLLTIGVVVWWFERRRNPDQFGGGLRGVGSGLWWSAVTMTTVGYGDKAPQTLGGRIVGMIWMFASIILISTFTAAIASTLTAERLGTAVRGPDDLPGVRVGTVAGSTSEAYLQRENVRARRLDDVEAALAALADGDVDAVVYDAPILLYLTSRREANDLQVLPNRFELQQYAFALPSGSALREPVNRIILRQLEEEPWRQVLRRWLGE